MSYDSHSKHVILIAIVHILGYIFYVLAPATSGIIMTISYDASTYADFLSIFNLMSVSFYMLMTILAGLMIRGVLKQRHVLIAPWLIMSSLSLIAMFAMFIMSLMEADILINLAYNLETLGMQILCIYPTYTLYLKLRPKSLKQESSHESVEIKKKETHQILV